MEPRLKTSIKWTPFPEELRLQIQEVLTERFSTEYDIDSYEFIVQGRIYNEEILLLTGLHCKNLLKQPNFELSLQFSPENDKVFDKIRESMNLVDTLWEHFLEEDMTDSELPIKWDSISFGNLDAFYKYSTINTELEKQADILLQQFDKKLVYEGEGPDQPVIPLEPESTELH